MPIEFSETPESLFDLFNQLEQKELQEKEEGKLSTGQTIKVSNGGDRQKQNVGLAYRFKKTVLEFLGYVEDPQTIHRLQLLRKLKQDGGTDLLNQVLSSDRTKMQEIQAIKTKITRLFNACLEAERNPTVSKKTPEKILEEIKQKFEELEKRKNTIEEFSKIYPQYKNFLQQMERLKKATEHLEKSQEIKQLIQELDKEVRKKPSFQGAVRIQDQQQQFFQRLKISIAEDPVLTKKQSLQDRINNLSQEDISPQQAIDFLKEAYPELVPHAKKVFNLIDHYSEHEAFTRIIKERDDALNVLKSDILSLYGSSLEDQPAKAEELLRRLADFEAQVCHPNLHKAILRKDPLIPLSENIQSKISLWFKNIADLREQLVLINIPDMQNLSNQLSSSQEELRGLSDQEIPKSFMHAFTEIIKTEQTFRSQLEDLSKYMATFQELVESKQKTPLPPEVINKLNAVLAKAQIFIDFNAQLLIKMEKLNREQKILIDGRETPALMHIFLTEDFNVFAEAEQIQNEFQEVFNNAQPYHKQLIDFLREIRASISNRLNFKNDMLNSLFFTPMQRLSRYGILLQALKKEWSKAQNEHSPTTYIIEAGRRRVENIITMINNR